MLSRDSLVAEQSTLNSKKMRVANKKFRIIVPGRVRNRLSKTCFRPNSIHCAGNFSLWESSEDLLKEPSVKAFIIEEAEAILNEGKTGGIYSVTYTHTENVGWSSTNDRMKYSHLDLEDFFPNRKSMAMRINTTRKDILAPLTNDITFVLELSSRNERPFVVIKSIYPGNDIGDLEGNITKREGVVFFDWNHPGEE